MRNYFFLPKLQNYFFNQNYRIIFFTKITELFFYINLEITEFFSQISAAANRVYLGGDSLMLNLNSKDYDDNLDKVTTKRR